MKTEDLLLYGGVAVVAYMILIKPKSAVQPALPVTNAGYLPSSNPITTTANPVASATSSITSIISKLFPTGSSSPAPAQTVVQPTPASTPASNPAYNDITDIFTTAPLTYNPYTSPSIAPASSAYSPPAESYTYAQTSNDDISNQFSNDIFDEEED